jgi:lysophospholipase L1-like esterase
MPTHPAGALRALALALLAVAGGAFAEVPPAVPPPAQSPFQVPVTDDGLPGGGPINRTDSFKSLWAERRTGWSTMTAHDQGALVFLGDSITQGWRDASSSFAGIKIANRGIGGDTTRGVLIRLKEDVLALNPSGVVLLIGTNDLSLKAEPEVIAGNLKLIITALRQHNPKMPVILCLVFPSTAASGRPADQIKRINALYLKAVEGEPQVTVLDTWSLFADPTGNAKLEEMPDLLHPNVLGYAKWAAALRPALEATGLAPAWPDEFTPEPGFVSLFDGTDLGGWQYPGRPPLEGKPATDDGRYIVRNGRIVVTASHSGQPGAKLWTRKQFPGDFVLRLEFRASPNADSGVYVRVPQLQCRDFLIAGPFATLTRYRPLDWNEIEVTVRGGLAHCTCNGEVLLDAMPVPSNGPIGLESDRGQMEYRRIRIHQAQ